MQETAALRQNLSSYLTGPRIGTVDLRAKLDSLALEEGKERQCDYVLYVSVVRKRQVATRGYSAPVGTKAGDEFTFDYKVVATNGGESIANTLKGAATADGDDVITGMIETVAKAVVELANAAKPPSQKTLETSTAAAATPEPATLEATPTAPAQTGYGSLSATPPRSRTSSVNDPPKQVGTIRIGMVTPRVNFMGSGPSGSGEAAALRQNLSAFLEGSTIETIELKARLDSLALNEAHRRECDYVLYTNLLRTRKSSSAGGGGQLGAIMGNIGTGPGPKLPGAKKAKDAGSEAVRVTNTIAAVAKANDEITFEYRLVTSVGARPILAKSSKAKVKADGEDVLTPMIESAAIAIVDALQKN